MSDAGRAPFSQLPAPAAVWPLGALDAFDSHDALDSLRPLNALDVVRPLKALDLPRSFNALNLVGPFNALDLLGPFNALGLRGALYTRDTAIGAPILAPINVPFRASVSRIHRSTRRFRTAGAAFAIAHRDAVSHFDSHALAGAIGTAEPQAIKSELRCELLREFEPLCRGQVAKVDIDDPGAHRTILLARNLASDPATQRDLVLDPVAGQRRGDSGEQVLSGVHAQQEVLRFIRAEIGVAELDFASALGDLRLDAGEECRGVYGPVGSTRQLESYFLRFPHRPHAAFIFNGAPIFPADVG